MERRYIQLDHKIGWRDGGTSFFSRIYCLLSVMPIILGSETCTRRSMMKSLSGKKIAAAAKCRNTAHWRLLFDAQVTRAGVTKRREARRDSSGVRAVSRSHMKQRRLTRYSRRLSFERMNRRQAERQVRPTRESSKSAAAARRQRLDLNVPARIPLLLEIQGADRLRPGR